MPANGGRQHLLPNGKRFTLKPVGDIRWQPDSQGWITVDDEPPQTLTVTRYSVKSDRSVSVQRVPSPFDLKPLRDANLRLPVIGVTPQDELMLEERKAKLALEERDIPRLHFVPLRPGARPRSVTLPANLYRLFPGCDAILVCVEIGEGPSARFEFQRIPLFGGKVERLFSVERRVFEFSLSPDGRSLLYRLWPSRWRSRLLGASLERGIDEIVSMWQNAT